MVELHQYATTAILAYGITGIVVILDKRTLSNAYLCSFISSCTLNSDVAHHSNCSMNSWVPVEAPAQTLWVCSCSVTTITLSFTSPDFSYQEKVTTCCPPLIHWRTYVLWSSSSFNITVFSFPLGCASGCWIFTIFLPSRLFNLEDYIDYRLYPRLLMERIFLI